MTERSDVKNMCNMFNESLIFFVVCCPWRLL